jgi:hypothetical protein
MRDGKSRPLGVDHFSARHAADSASGALRSLDVNQNNSHADARTTILTILARHLPDLPRILSDRPIG